MLRFWFVGLIAASLLSGCDESGGYGSGVGRSAWNFPASTALQGLVISEVYVDEVVADSFVELYNASSASITLDGWTLCDHAACFSLEGALTAGSRQVLQLQTLTPHRSVGMVAVLDAAGTVQDLLAWGGDPIGLARELVTNAVQSGAARAGEYAALPFPLPEGVAVARELDDNGDVVMGCAAPSGTGNNLVATIDATLCPMVSPCDSPVLRLTEALPQLSDGAASWVEVENLSDDGLDLFGVRLCHRAGDASTLACATLGEGAALETGTKTVLYLGGSAPEETANTPVDLSSLPALGRDGDVALLAPGAVTVDTASAVLGFAAYGETGGTFLSLAVDACAWPNETGAALAPRVAGESVSRSADGTWHPSEATPGADNPVTWTSCSYPNPDIRRTPSDLVISTLSRTEPPVLWLTHRQAGPDFRWQDLSWGDYRVTVGSDVAVELSDLVTADYGASDEDGWPAGTEPLSLALRTDADLSANGEVSLVGSTESTSDAFLQYLRWGDGAQAQVEGAVAAGVWPLSGCTVSTQLELDGAIELIPGLEGQGSADYREAAITPER